MELDIIEEIARAEAEAEELLKHSKAKVKELERETEEAISQLKQALEGEFKVRAEELRQLRYGERQQAEARLSGELAEAQAKLKESAEKKSGEAVRFILQKLVSSKE